LEGFPGKVQLQHRFENFMERRLLCKVEKIRIFIKKGSTNTRETKESPQKERAQKKILGIL